MVITVNERRLSSALGIITRAEELVKVGERTGNFGLVTSSKVCRAIALMDANAIHQTILEEMGISADVSEVEGGLMIEVSDHHSVSAIMNACRTFFDVIGAMGKNGRKAIRVSVPQALPKIEQSSNTLQFKHESPQQKETA